MQEELLYDHLLAAARVDEWLDAVRFKSKPREVRRDALAHLARHVLASDLYFEEARIQRASEVLTKALSSTTDEDLLDLISTALTACSGTGARGTHTTSYELAGPNHPVPLLVWVKEREIGAGVGVRIWAAATVLCREMLTRPSLVAGRNVLELGSGCGLCGLLAVKMGAATVCVSDFEASVLDNLRESVRLNTTDAPAPDAWDMGDVHVRYLSWGDDMERCRAGDLGGSEQEGEWPSVNNPSSAEAPSLSPDATYVDGFCAFCLIFPVIIASDVMYELECCTMLAHTMRRRLAPGGCAVMVNAIRQRVFLPAFVGTAESLGLRVHLVDVDPTQTSACDGAPGFALSVNGMPTDISCSGIMGKGQGYEGGYKLFLIDRADAPYPWTEFASLVPY